MTTYYKTEKRYYAIDLRSFKIVCQSDNFDLLLKRCKQLANNFVDGNAKFKIYDRHEFRMERSQIGTFDNEGFYKYTY